MRINNNIMALNTWRQLNLHENSLAKAMQRLSSGKRINSAADDPAGLAISEKMKAQIRGLNMASRNSQDAISLVQTAEGALNETHSILQRMRELAVQSANGTNDDSVDRAALEAEFGELQKEIDDIADKTNFNGRNLLNGNLGRQVTVGIKDTVPIDSALEEFAKGVEIDPNNNLKAFDYISTSEASGSDPAQILFSNSYAVYAGEPESGKDWVSGTRYNIVDTSNGNSIVGTIKFKFEDSSEVQQISDLTFELTGQDMFVQCGPNEGDEMGISIGNMGSKALGIDSSISIATRDGASKAIGALDDAIEKVSVQRAKLGADQTRLETKIDNLETTAENLQAAESRITDADMAQEYMEYARENLLCQVSTAMLAQANKAPEEILQLLKSL
ncbi:MAG: flagellin [Bacillota bacterium]|nr:flagellin [Bacillota bacterium]